MYIAGKTFAACHVEPLTDSWYKKSVKHFVKHPKKFDRLIHKATRYISTSQPACQPAGVIEAPDIFDCSSPPLEDEDEDEDGTICELSYVSDMQLAHTLLL